MTNLWLPNDLADQHRPLMPAAGPYHLTDGRALRADRRFPQSADNGPGYHYAGPAGLSVIATLDHAQPHGKLLHVSLAYPNRLPDWETVRMVKEAFFPEDIDACMILPRKDDYINLHEYCLHIWQLPVKWGLQ